MIVWVKFVVFPVRWTQGDTVITMAFDRMGRRVEMRTVKDGEETLQRFVYDNYLCVQQLRGTANALFQSYIWDPTEPIATRPLVFQPASGEIAYYFHDGNKNVSDLVSLSGVAVHYDYTPFGTCNNANDVLGNPIRFSSEMHDGHLGLVYYNYRHYALQEGRWCAHDWYDEGNLFLFCENNPMNSYDFLGDEKRPLRNANRPEHTKNARRSTRDKHQNATAHGGRMKHNFKQRPKRPRGGTKMNAYLFPPGRSGAAFAGIMLGELAVRGADMAGWMDQDLPQNTQTTGVRDDSECAPPLKRTLTSISYVRRWTEYTWNPGIIDMDMDASVEVEDSVIYTYSCCCGSEAIEPEVVFKQTQIRDSFGPAYGEGWGYYFRLTLRWRCCSK